MTDEILTVRVGNLETMVMILANTLRELSPPGSQDTIDSVINDYFETANDMGVEINTEMIVADNT
jgi:hypothetical protein